MNKLMKNYDRVGRIGRPVRNVSTSVPVHFGLGLIQMSLNEKDKILSMSMWTRYVSTKIPDILITLRDAHLCIP